MKFVHALGFERNRTTKHSIKENSKTPNVCSKTLITTIGNYFRCDVSWCTTLFGDSLLLTYDTTYSKVTYFDLTFVIKKNIVKFDISMEYRSAMAMSNTVNNLFEYPSCFLFF